MISLIFGCFSQKYPQRHQENLKNNQIYRGLAHRFIQEKQQKSNTYFVDIADNQRLIQYDLLSNVLFCALEGLTTLQNPCDNERATELEKNN